MVGFFAFAGLAVFWVFFVWLVKREQGWVGVTDYRRAMLRFTGKMILLADALVRGLTPVIRQAAKAMAAWHDAWHMVGEPGEPPFENGWRNAGDDPG